jgi:hypothetical protein
MALDFNKTISQFIENQFPGIYREEGELLVAFITAYYEYLEETGLLNRKMFDLRDIDETFDEFVIFFRRKYLDGFPFISATDDRFLVKNIIDFYRSKGSEQSLKLLMRLLFNEEVGIYYPRLDILRASNSRWIVPTYIELTPSQRSIGYVGKEVKGSLSGATGFVEGLVSKRINGRIIDLLYVSSVKGNFTVGDLISDDGSLLNAPKMVGSLTSVDMIETNTAGYSVGQKLKVISPNGRDAVARITKVFTASDRVNIELLEGGFGYTTDSDTKVYISNDVIFCDNEGLEFIDFELVKQNLETINKPTGPIQLGNLATGYDSANTVVAEGRIVSINDTTMTVELDTGTFTPQYTLELDSINTYDIGTIIEIEKTVDLILENILGVFVVGEEILQREIVNGISTRVATGIIDDVVSANELSIDNAFGKFEVGLVITGKTSGATAIINGTTITSFDGKLQVISADTNEIVVVPYVRSPDPLSADSTEDDTLFQSITLGDLETKEIKDVFSNNRNFVDLAIDNQISVDVEGSQEIVTSFSDSSALGFVIGQSQENVGISGNQNPFIFIPETPNFINTSISGLTKEISKLGAGSGANFEILELENQELIDLGSELISDDNIVGIQFLNVSLGGANVDSGTIETNSGVGRLSEINILDGGSGYSNDSIVEFIGGGFGDSEVTFPASGSVITDGSGVITDIIITDPGEGYWVSPSIIISDGSDANVEIIMDYGFGFEKEPYSDLSTVINDALNKKQSIIGTISRIGNISRGSGYDTNPYLRVVNPIVRSYNINDAWLTRGLQTGGTFSFDEIVQASNGARGKIIAFDQNRILVKKLSFTDRFEAPDILTGLTSGTTAPLLELSIQPSRVMGDNSNFRTFVNLADGIIAEVEIVSSGYGYFDNELISLIDKNNQFAASGISRLAFQAKGVGYWETTSSHLNDKKLHDNKFYQEFSYQVRGSISFDRYEVIVRNLLHVAGMELFGKIEINTKIETEKTIDTSISIGSPIFTSTDMIGDNNIVGITYEVINIDASESGVGRLSSNVTIIDGGSGYSNDSVVEFIGGGPDSNTDPISIAEASVVTDEFGSITSVVIIDGGEGYWEVPTVAISDGDGANIEFSIEIGYGFPKLPYSNEDTNIGDAISEGEILFAEEEVLF